jgi:hypothetical protein
MHKMPAGFLVQSLRPSCVAVVEKRIWGRVAVIRLLAAGF